MAASKQKCTGQIRNAKLPGKIIDVVRNSVYSQAVNCLLTFYAVSYFLSQILADLASIL